LRVWFLETGAGLMKYSLVVSVRSFLRVKRFSKQSPSEHRFGFNNIILPDCHDKDMNYYVGNAAQTSPQSEGQQNPK
jgi:hypothetical protein